MARATGIGGVFMKSRDPKKLMQWYAEHLGLESNDQFVGSVLKWREYDEPEKIASSVFGLFEQDTEYFNPSVAPYMVNFRVDDLDGLLARLRAAGCKVEDKIEEMEGIGRFGWVIDPEGRKVELWEPAAGQ
ncbi:MAG: VOC family protein [Parvularculaceae bacterium]